MTAIDDLRAKGTLPKEVAKVLRYANLPFSDVTNLQAVVALIEPAIRAMAERLEKSEPVKCEDCDCREGTSHYCLLWSINTPDDHWCKDAAAHGQEQP